LKEDGTKGEFEKFHYNNDAMLSNTCKYAIRATIYLAVNATKNNKIGIKKIAEDLEIPTPFLGKILQILAKNKILSSTKGPNGGFGIGRDPSSIRLMELVEIIDGTDSFENCIIGLHPCKDQGQQCSVHDSYAPMREGITKIFNKKTIQDLAEEVKKGKQKINI
jgi:Rrf2 family transcriptional regulator, iron-sulfur cluster assembly transcription factor